MITLKQIQSIYAYLKKQYPLSLPSEITTFVELMELKLSHFDINGVSYYNQILDSTGLTHVELNSEWISIDTYATLMTRFTPIRSRGALLQHPTRLITCNLPSYTIQRLKQGERIEIPKYLTYEKAFPVAKSSTSGANHFTISSFIIDDNTAQLSEVIGRLWKVRDSYSTLHFHLEENTGGDLIPVHLIMLCLCGGHQKWMTEYEVIERYKGRNVSRKWDPWSPWDPDNHDYKNYKKLDLDETELFHYTTPYKGKIVLHMDTKCTSSTWYFITYLVYVFAARIERFTKYVHGVPIKCGTARGPQIELHGYSGTTSGDGNPVHKNFILDGTTVTGYFPTQANIHRPIQERDWNRFWIEA
jgi:hypothetical protein